MVAYFVIKDHNGYSIVARTYNLGENTTFITKALTLRAALKFAKIKCFKNVCVKMTQPIIDSILNKCRPPWWVSYYYWGYQITCTIIFFYTLGSCLLKMLNFFLMSFLVMDTPFIILVNPMLLKKFFFFIVQETFVFCSPDFSFWINLFFHKIK